MTGIALPEWLVEHGIGESRYARIDQGEITQAFVRREGVVAAGSVLDAKLVSIAPRVVVEAEGQEYLLPRGSSGISEGAGLRIEVVREALGGPEPWKRALARQTDKEVGEAPGEIEAREARIEEWDDLVEEARSGIARFDGGELRIEPTAAMTTIDVDGWLVPDKLAQKAAWAAALAIARLDLAGSIAIDFPTVEGKAARTAIGEILDHFLPRPFERTAMNGFGLVQVVRPKTRPSLIDLAQDRASFEARALLRRAARETGAITLVAHPAVIAAIRDDWRERLARNVGGAVGLRAEPALAMSGAYVE